MSPVSKKRKAEAAQATFDELRQAALDEHKQRAGQMAIYLKQLRDAAAGFKQVFDAPRPQLETYKSFAHHHTDELKPKKARRYTKCSHAGCNASMVGENAMVTDLCTSGHPHHHCYANRSTCLGTKEACRLCKLHDDHRGISQQINQIRDWNASIKSLQPIREPWSL